MGVPMVKARPPECSLEAGLSSGSACSWPHEKFLLDLHCCFFHMDFELTALRLARCRCFLGLQIQSYGSQSLNRNIQPSSCLHSSGFSC